MGNAKCILYMVKSALDIKILLKYYWKVSSEFRGYIKYTYTSDYDNTNRSARYFKASGELGSGVPTRTVTVTDANTSR